MNSSNVSLFESHFNGTEETNREEHRHPLFFLFALLIAVAGTCVNGLVVYIYWRSPALGGASMKAVVHLAITDCLSMSLLGIDLLIFMLSDNLSNFLCMLAYVPLFYMTFVSQCVLGVASIDRHISICHPITYTKFMSKRNQNILFIAAWLVPLPISVLWLLDFHKWLNSEICAVSFLFERWVFIVHSLFSVTVMTLSVILYIPILVKAWSFHARSYPALFHGVNTKTMQMKAKRRRFINSLFIGALTLLSIVFNLPYSIVRLLLGLQYPMNGATVFVTFSLGILNSVVNPFLYAWQKEEFRKEAKHIFPLLALKTRWYR